jgi:hypothetical protein
MGALWVRRWWTRRRRCGVQSGGHTRSTPETTPADGEALKAHVEPSRTPAPQQDELARLQAREQLRER